MTLRLVFNPFLGSLDYVDTFTGSTGAPSTPTLVAAGQTYTLADNTQVTYRRSIVLLAGASIVVGSNAVLQSVT